MDLTPFATLLAGRTRSDGRTGFAIPEDWLQGRTSFGGLIAAIAVQAMRDAVGAAWPIEVSLRALQTSFVGPVGAGPVDVAVQLLREGKSARQVEARVLQNGQVCAVMLGVFSSDRPSVLAPLRPQRPPIGHAAEALAQQGLGDPRVPAFLKHFDRRWADGPMPYSGGSGDSISLWIRLIEPQDEVTAELMTVLLADLSPTPVIGQLRQPTPSSSVTWALELRPVAHTGETGWWRADTEALVVDGGYVNQAARLWEPGGQLAALSYQVVTVFA
jgi:acyl-CoA thioesterase